MKSDRASGRGVQVLHKTIDVLDTLRCAPTGLSLANLSDQVRMPKPTVYRIVATLESRGYLERLDGAVYRISRKLFEAPRQMTLEQQLIRAARPAMEQLIHVCKETLNLGVLDGGEVLVIDTLESPQTVRMSSKIGNRRYPHSTALGKVLLADLPHREMMRLVQKKGLPRFTSSTIVELEALVLELERVRSQGHAIDNSENEVDGRCVAAPIMAPNRRVLAALSISGPLPRMTITRAKSFLGALKTACHNIESAFG